MLKRMDELLLVIMLDFDVLIIDTKIPTDSPH